MKPLEEAKKQFQNRQFERSISILQPYLKIHPDSGEGWMGLGLSLICSGSAVEGIDALKKAQQCDPNNPKVYQASAMILRLFGRVKEAISYLQTAAIFAPVLLQPEIHLSLATLQACLGDKEAIQLELQLLAKLQLIEPRKQLELYQEAQDFAGLKLFVERLSGDVKMLGAAVLLEETDQHRAEELYLSLCGNESELWEAYEYLARMYWELKQDHIGQEFLRKAQTLAPQTAKVQLTSALYHVHKDPAAAKLQLQKLASYPGIFHSTRENARQQLESLLDRY